jgi:hypothetical protein
MQMIEVANEPKHGGCWQTIVARPGMAVQRGNYIGETSVWFAGSSGSFIRADELALALIDAVMHDSNELLLPNALLQRGQKLFKASSPAGVKWYAG